MLHRLERPRRHGRHAVAHRVVRVYAKRQKQTGKDVLLSAAELVRRTERCIGLAIRRGQAQGLIGKKGDQRSNQILHKDVISVKDIIREGSQTITETYAMTDGVTDEEFEVGLAKARAEDNLSRANVVRKGLKTR